jgi:RNA polymerase sigma-70 factor, ECF subfamily
MSRNPLDQRVHSTEEPRNATGRPAGYRCVPEIGEQRPEDAFAQYVLPELEVLTRVAMSLTRHTSDAEDLVQETLLCAYQGIDRFDGAHPRAWLLTIMRNAEAKRHRRRRPSLLRDADDVERWESADSGLVSDSAEHVVVGRQFEAVVAECLAVLPERHRQVVELVDIDGLSYAEAAGVIGVPVGTVMSRLHRARARIRRRLSAAGLAPKRNLI